MAFSNVQYGGNSGAGAGSNYATGLTLGNSGTNRILVIFSTNRGNGSASNAGGLDMGVDEYYSTTAVASTSYGTFLYIAAYVLKDADLPAVGGTVDALWTDVDTDSAFAHGIQFWYAEGASQGALTDSDTFVNDTTAASITLDTAGSSDAKLIAHVSMNTSGQVTTTSGQTVIYEPTQVSSPSSNHAASYRTDSTTTLGYDNSAPGTGKVAVALSIAQSAASPPTLTSGPTASSITSAGYDIKGTPDQGGTAYLIVTAVGASQPSDGTFDASGESATMTASTEFTIHHTGQ